jgi:hypothetical protein
MKKLIKFLFPKTYQAIYSEGYNACYCEAYGSHQEYYHDDYHDNYDDDYPEGYFEEQAEQELAEEWERECREEGRALAELHLPKAPKLQIGDKVHLHSKQGMYTITEVYNDSFGYCTNYSETSYADYSDYKCHAGGKWNNRGV